MQLINYYGLLGVKLLTLVTLLFFLFVLRMTVILFRNLTNFTKVDNAEINQSHIHWGATLTRHFILTAPF